MAAPVINRDSATAAQTRHGVQRVAGRYDVDFDHPLGQGGMAVVYRATDRQTGGPVALKTLREEYRTDPGARARFRHEVRVQKDIRHPNIATLIAVVEGPDAPWAVQEFIDGVSLRDLLADRGPLPPSELVLWLDQTTSALDYLHQKGIVHLDIKPQNLLLTTAGAIKLIDFGLAQQAGRIQEPIGGTMFGTLAYLSPEQASGQRVEASADLYALGCVWYELLTGHPPFDPDQATNAKRDVIRAHLEEAPRPPSTVAPLTSAIDQVILRALAKDPADRYPSVTALALQFRQSVQTHRPEKTHTTDILHLPPSHPHQRRSPAEATPRWQTAAGNLAQAGYRTGGRAARRILHLRTTLWKITAIFAIADCLLAVLLVWHSGTAALLPGGATLEVGGQAEVIVDDLNLRAGPDLSAPSLDRLDSGAELTLEGQPITTAGRTWWPVSLDGGAMDGYVWAGGITPAAERPGWMETIRHRLDALPLIP